MRALAVAAEQRLAAVSRRPDPRRGRVPRHARRRNGWPPSRRPRCRPRSSRRCTSAFVKAMSVPEMQEAFARGGMVVAAAILARRRQGLAARRNGELEARHRRHRHRRGGLTLKIGILLGDDIGLEVVPECVKVMKAAAARERLDDRLAAAADRQGGPRGARRHPSGGDRAGVARARRLDHGTDRARRLSARRRDLGDAAGAQEIRPVRGGAPVAVARHHCLDPQERRHRVPARAHRGHALFRDRGRRAAGVPARTTTSPSRCA